MLAAIAIICALRVGGEFTARAFFSVHLDSTWAVSTARIGGALALSNLLRRSRTAGDARAGPALGARAHDHGGRDRGCADDCRAGPEHDLGDGVCGVRGADRGRGHDRSVWSLVVQEAVPEAWRATSAGVANLFSGLGTMAMSSVGGVMAASLGYRATFLTSAALVGLGAVVVWTTLGQVKRPATPV